ncbi:RING-CH-type domain-containing protein [Lachancea thermotolerans]
MAEEQNKCWICLCSGDEYPPMGNSKDAHDWVHPCQCSLTAHRKCLLEWVSRTNLDYRNEALNEFNGRRTNIGFESLNIADTYSSLHGRAQFHPFAWLRARSSFTNNSSSRAPFDPGDISRIFAAHAEEAVIRNVTQAMAAGARESQPMASAPSSSRKLVINTVCPQCHAPILLKTSRGVTVSLSSSVSHLLDWSAKTLIQVTAIGTLGSSILFSFGGILASWGLRIMTTVAPESTLLKLLDLNSASTLSQAFQKNQIGFKQILLLGFAPLYLISFRCGNAFLGWLKWFYPLAFLRPEEKLQSSVKRFLILQYPLAMLNDFFRMCVYNPVYFRWVHRVKPYFIGDRMTVEQLKIYEAEQEYLETRFDALSRGNQPRSLLTKFKSFFMSVSPEPMIQSISARRLVMSMRYDYSQALIEISIWEKIASTLLWPLAGKLISDTVLSKSKWFKRFVAQETATPDDGLYLSNLIGCCAAVLLKDLVHLFVTWRRVKQLESMEVMSYMTPEWEYAINKKIGQVLNDLSSLKEDEESYVILEEHANNMLTKPYHDQWTNVGSNIPTILGKVGYFRFLVIKMSIERSLAYTKKSRTPLEKGTSVEIISPTS